MSQKFEMQYSSLVKKYNKEAITIKELSNELSVSVSTIHNYIARGIGIPKYKKLGKAKNAKIVFPLIEVAEFLVNTNEVF